MLEQVVELVSKGYYFYSVMLGPEDDMPAFEREMKDWAEEVKRSIAMTHPHDGLQFFADGRFCLLIATPGLREVLAKCNLRLEDVRQRTIPCCGYGVSCKKMADGYSVLVHGLSGKQLDLSRP